MTEAKYLGNISPILSDNWTDNTPTYYSYYKSHMKRKAAKKKLGRERLVFFVTMVIIVAISMSIFSLRPEGSESYEDNRVHSVMYGDTLWSIANEYKSEKQSTGEFVYEIKKINSLVNSSIAVGDVLVIPD